MMFIKVRSTQKEKILNTDLFKTIVDHGDTVMIWYKNDEGSEQIYMTLDEIYDILKMGEKINVK